MPQPDHQHPQHSDMPETGWWRMLPHSLHRFIYLGRFDRPIGWWLLLLPGWWVIPVGTTSVSRMWWLMALFLVGAIITRAAGCVINDLWDRRLDQQVERTQQRPLASGAVSVAGAFIFLGILGAIGVGILWQLPDIAIYVGLAAAPLVIIYPLAKRITWFPQFVLGLHFPGGSRLAGRPAPAHCQMGQFYVSMRLVLLGYSAMTQFMRFRIWLMMPLLVSNLRLLPLLSI